MTDQNNPPAPVAGDTGADAGQVATVFLKGNNQYGIMWLRPIPFVDGKATLFVGGAEAVPSGTPGLNREDFLKMARVAGGKFHGPVVEHLSISEEDYLVLAESIYLAGRYAMKMEAHQ